ncbi:MAG: transcriptional regulator [Candidatus Marinimicrobia bacterium]|nr:transcriptional regulator [Candidatus Neomarinimicrobiota bacterium]|tara:strand:- start:30066 stop:30614 length:549 start_codon:yes stop_codon:yes gene_type:complete
MLDSLITSKTRLKLLMKFFMNPGTRAYLRELAKEFNESTNSIRIELNRLSDAKFLTYENAGRTIEYRANIHHPLFSDISSLVKKYMGIDQIIDKLVKKLGDVKTSYLIGDYARGIDSGLIDIVLVGNINKTELDRIATERGLEISRKIRPLVLTEDELQKLWIQLNMNHALLIWGEEISLRK